MKFNKKSIMTEAHELYRDGRFGTWVECLKKAWFNAKAVKATVEALEEEAHTWFGWTLLGYEVRHGETAVAKAEVFKPLKTKTTTNKAFFTRAQVVELGTQPPKAQAL